MPANPLPPSADAELRLAETQVSTILTIAADAVISLNEQMRITLFNDGACAMIGYAKNEIIGKPLDVLIPERFRSKHGPHVAEFSASGIAARKWASGRRYSRGARMAASFRPKPRSPSRTSTDGIAPWGNVPGYGPWAAVRAYDRGVL